MTSNTKYMGSRVIPHRIENPSAWYRENLETDTSWISPFEKQHIEELDAGQCQGKLT